MVNSPSKIENRKSEIGNQKSEISVAEQAYRFTLPFVFLVVALLIFPNAWTPVGMVGALAVLAVRWWARGAPFPRTALNPFLVALLAMVAVGLWLSPAPDIAWMRAAHVVAGVLVSVTVVDRADTERNALAVTGALVLVAVAFAVGAPFVTAWGGAQGLGLGELTARLTPLLARPSNVNSVAGALEAAVPLALALIAANQRPWRLVGALALAPLLVMLLLLQSRGAWLAVAMGLVVYATLYRRWVLPLVPLVLLGGLWLNSAAGEPVATQALGAGGGHDTVTLGDRTEIWSEAGELLASAPLTGIGLNGFSARGAPQVGSGTGIYTLSGSHAHNLFLEVALDTGIVGLLAFVGILAVGVAAAWRVYRAQPRSPVLHALAIGVLAAFAVIVTHGMFDLIFWGFKGGVFLWGVVGLAQALKNLEISK